MSKELTTKEIKEIRKNNMNLKFIKEEDIDLEKYFGLIYITIFPDGFIYVGYTQKIPGIWRYNNYFGSGCTKEFREAKKLHKGKLKKEILHVIYKDGVKIDEQLFHHLEQMELVYHIKTNCTNKQIGYNKMKGADLRTKGKMNIMKDPDIVRKASENRKGWHHTEDAKKNISLNVTKGMNHHNYGRDFMTEEHKNNLIRANSGPQTKEHKENAANARRGNKWSLSRIKKQSGKGNYFYGKKVLEETKNKLRKTREQNKQICFVCGGLFTKSSITMYHNNNCKFKV